MSATGAARCQARYTPNGRQCEREQGHPGMHWADLRSIRWGGRYTRAELNGKPRVMKDADAERSARIRRPRGQRCSVCYQPREKHELKNGQCADKIECAKAQPYLFGAEAMPAAGAS